MNDAEFHQIGDDALESLYERLEPTDTNGAIELEYQGGILTIELENGKQFIVSKHAPTRQLWLSSPLSGGLHFPYNGEGRQWQLADGRTLPGVLMQELKTLAAIEVAL